MGRPPLRVPAQVVVLDRRHRDLRPRSVKLAVVAGPAESFPGPAPRVA